jgi:hypothetical protein
MEEPIHEDDGLDLPKGDQKIDRVGRYWAEGASRIEARFKIESLEPNPHSFLKVLLRYVVDHLDNLGRSNLGTVHLPAHIEGRYLPNLRSAADQLYEVADRHASAKATPADLGPFQLAVRTVFESRILLWKAEALRWIREREAAQMIFGTTATQGESPADASKDIQNTIVDNHASTHRTRGPKPNQELALRISEVVAQVASDGDWRSKLDDICDALDENGIPCPKTWRAREEACRNWSSQLNRSLVIKAIDYRLKTGKPEKDH